MMRQIVTPKFPTAECLDPPSILSDEKGCGRYRDHRQGIFDRVLDEASPARMKGCWRQRRPSSPRAGARPFGLRGLTPSLPPTKALHAIDASMWLNSPSRSPDRMVYPFSEHRSTAPTAYASQPQQSAWV